MSDRIRRAAGLFLTVLCVLLCLVSALCARSGQEIRFRSGGIREEEVQPIPTEQNGNVSVNSADADELPVLPGIGETLSALIISERRENGPYFYAEDLEAVKGIGPATLNRFRDMIDLSQEESGE